MSISAMRWTVVAIAICLLGLGVLVARAEYVVATRPHWHFEVEGYDPRDLLHGRYLQLRYRFNRVGEDTCRDPFGYEQPRPADDGEFDVQLEPGCCLCLTRTHPEGIDPEVRQVSCDEARSCDGWMRSEAALPPVRYFVPEARALELERALQSGGALLEVVIDPEGQPSMVDLELASVR